MSTTAIFNSTLRILLIGQGGREHALAWKLCQSPKVEHIYVVPGNGGTAILSKTSNHTDIAINDYSGLVRVAEAWRVNLVIVGSDEVIIDGIEDFFQTGKSD